MPRIGLRWWIAILLCLITTVNYIDRQALAVAGPVITEQFGLSNIEFGRIVSGFLFAYALGQVTLGPVIDRIGTKRSLGIAVVAWSIAGMLHAAGRGFWSFLSFRALLGFTEASNFPAALKAIAEWFPRADRSLATGIVTAGPGLGALIAPPLCGWLIIEFGWQWAFIVPGAAGFVWLAIWQWFYYSPEDHPRLSAEERALILADRDEEAPAAPGGEPVARYAPGTVAGQDGQPGMAATLAGYLRHREVWGLVLARFFGDGAFYFYVSWLPLYLSQVRGFNIAEIAFVAWIPFLAADLGSIGGGWAGRRLILSGWSVNRSRKTIIWAGALAVPLTMPAVGADSAVVAIAVIAIANFAIQVRSSSLFSLPADLFPSRDVAGVWGLFGAVGSVGGALFNLAVGWTTQHYSYGPVFVAVGATQVLSALFISWLIPEIKTIKK